MGKEVQSDFFAPSFCSSFLHLFLSSFLPSWPATSPLLSHCPSRTFWDHSHLPTPNAADRNEMNVGAGGADGG